MNFSLFTKGDVSLKHHLEAMSTLKLTIDKFINFIEVDLWRTSLSSLPRFKSFIYKTVRIIVLASKGYIRDDCSSQASALTFLSMLSVVPVLAMFFGISKGFGLEKNLRAYLLDSFSGHEEIMLQSFEYSQKLLDSTRGGLIAGIGLLVLLYTVMRLLHNIEITFDKIWEITKHRTFVRKLTDYLAIILIAPLLVILSSSATVFISTQLTDLTSQIGILGSIQPNIVFAIKLIPYTLIWLLFTLTYIILPNTKVSLKSGLIAGIVAGTLYQLVQWGYITFQVGVSKYNAIYGSFAAVPLFLIWMQFSWLIVLLGAEISFAHQNADKYQFDNDNLQISPQYKKLLALLVVKKIVTNFEKGDPPLDLDNLARVIEVPVRFVQSILKDLMEAQIIVEVASGDEPRFQPAIDINKIDIHFVIDRLESRGINNVSSTESEELAKISDSLKKINQEIASSEANQLLHKI